ncbi:MAG: hypothetical protein A2927_02790 [Candidatus Komeilibacteria bacterium RIFCSPLOWO2_01_FULL_45_10]|uniref:Uncharacterized protein n=1 Tax=Candidatus Komeilibacteria bacterium RIFCSPLOWO2_01_FULL_45_10 TaxID=1798550 RepID=A0A1G2BJM8_9BACT|nr:MAG: hypothetical protein A2927_02790 [Candidatus Komeilibacteria bacterium RIFCSPLOWO2_01_FULL_45_10]
MILTNEKRKVLSEISRDIGQVFFAATIVEPLARGAWNYQLMLIGFICALGAWYWSVSLKTNVNQSI